MKHVPLDWQRRGLLKWPDGPGDCEIRQAEGPLTIVGERRWNRYLAVAVVVGHGAKRKCEMTPRMIKKPTQSSPWSNVLENVALFLRKFMKYYREQYLKLKIFILTHYGKYKNTYTYSYISKTFQNVYEINAYIKRTWEKEN